MAAGTAVWHGWALPVAAGRKWHVVMSTLPYVSYEMNADDFLIEITQEEGGDRDFEICHSKWWTQNF